MSLNAKGYFNALRSHLNASYSVTEVDQDRIVLKDKIYLPDATVPTIQRVRLAVAGEALVIHLDKKNQRGSSEPLFRFLEDESKPWAKRCDFVVFHLHREQVSAYCIEFKSATLPDSLVDQLKASEAWCRSLHSVVKHYTGEARKLRLTKYVFSCHPDPAPYLDAEKKYLQRDHALRHYNYQEVDGMALAALDNTNVQIIG